MFLRHFSRKYLQYCGMVLALSLVSPCVLAHGGAPHIGQIALHPGNPAHWVARTTYGLISTIDSGKTWQWICETAIGYDGDAQANVVISQDGSILVTTPLGTKVSHDGGCDWQTPADLKGENDGIDLVRDTTDTASVLLLSRSIVGTDPNTPNLLRLLPHTITARAGIYKAIRFRSSLRLKRWRLRRRGRSAFMSTGQRTIWRRRPTCGVPTTRA